MAAESESSDESLSPASPLGIEPYYRPALVAVMAASVGVVIGSVGAWATVLMFTVGGLDFGNWGTSALILGVVSVLAVLTVAFWLRSPFDPRWAVPAAWGIAILGVACLTDAVINIVRLMTVPKASFFGVPIGVSAGWGLWLVAFSSAVIAVAGTIIAIQTARSDDVRRCLAGATDSWTDRWRRAAIITAAVIVVAGIVFAVTNPWKGDAANSESLKTPVPSFALFPSFSGFPTTTPSATSPRPVPHPVVDAPPLDGTYRQDIDEANITTDGRIDPGSDTDPHWFGFRSACTASGCVASGSYLDPHKLGLPLQQSSTALVAHWIGDHWQYSHTYAGDCSGPNGDAKEEMSDVWSLASQPDGFFRGTDTTTTLSDACSNEGKVRVEPFTLTRTGPPPPGAIDPPTNLAGQTQPPPPSAQFSPPEPRASVILGGQELSISSKSPLCVWTHGKAGIEVYAPNSDESVAQVADMTATGQVEHVAIKAGDLLYWFDDWTRRNQAPGASVSVTQKGRKSYTIAGVAAALDKTTGSYLLNSYEIDVTCP